MTVHRAITVGCLGLLGLLLAGCQTARQIGQAAESFDQLAQDTSELAKASAGVVERVDRTLASMDEHLVDTASEIPQIAKSTNAVLEGVRDGMARLTDVSEKTLTSTHTSIVTLTGSFEKVLGEVEELTSTARETLNTASGGVTTTSKAVADLSKALQATLAEITDFTGELKASVGDSLQEAVVAVHKGADSMVRMQESVTTSLNNIDGALDEIGATIARQDPEREQRFSDLLVSIRKFLDALVWLLTTGAVLLILNGVYIVQHRLTARRRHEKIARQLGLLPGEGGGAA